MKRFFGHFLVIIAMGLGLLTGWMDLPLFNQAATVSSDIFLRLLKLVSLPIIFLAITSTISGMKDFQEMRKLGRKVVTYTLGTTIVAASVALILFLIIQPVNAVDVLQSAAGTEPAKQASYLSFVTNIIPSNVVQAFVDNNVIGVAFISILFSLSILCLPSEQKEFLNKMFTSLFAATLKVTGFIIALMPVAVWAFMNILVKDLSNNFSHFSSLMLYLMCVIAANLVQGFIVLPALLKFKGIPVWKTLKGMLPALTLAFFSKSSNATLPVTMRSIENNIGVSKKVSSFTLPLCTVINMNGCAAFILITTLFVSMFHGMSFGPFEYVAWIFLATLAAVGNAGVPMGCFFLTSAFLLGLDVPLYMMGLILPFYTIIDMIETTLNVWSDACVTIVIDKDLAGKPVDLPQGVEEAA